MTTARVELPPKLIPVFTGKARYRGAYGGRGSGKSRSFAKMAAIRGYQLSKEGKSGVIVCGREFMNSLDESSLAEVKAAIESEPWLAAHYDVGEKFVRTKDGRISFAFIGLRHNLDSIKSKARIHILWVDEAEPVSDTAWVKVIPTVREHDSEIWITWNPERKNSATHKRFRQSPPEDAKIVELNWQDNPWFPEVLDKERRNDKEKRPEQYGHIWDGDFVTVVEGAYFAKSLIDAKQGGRIGRVPFDPLMTVRLFVDIGGTGARADAFSMWPAQFIGKEIRVRDYYEAVGQPLATHLNWLRSKGYGPDRAQFWLPHDGASHDKVFDVSYESALKEAGYSVTVVPNQGRGAAAARIEAARRLFPSIWFDEETTEAGRDALGWYHEKIDKERNVGLGPEHDWSSHGCLVAGSLVETERGSIPIEHVKIGDLVTTPAGLAKVTQAGPVKVATELIRLSLSDGRSLHMTPEHKVFTTRGVVYADALVYNDVVFTEEATSCLKLDRANSIGFRAAFSECFKEKGSGSGRSGGFTPHKKEAGYGSCIEKLLGTVRRKSSRLMGIGRILSRPTGDGAQRVPNGCSSLLTTGKSSTASATIASLGTAIIRGVTRLLSTCTALYGLVSTGRYRMGFTFTTSTVTKQTTAPETFVSYRPLSTPSFMLQPMSGSAAKQTNGSFGMRQSVPSIGIRVPKAESGISSTARMLGNVVWQLALSAMSAATNIRRSGRGSLGIAAEIVGKERVIANETVYDLTVEKHHCYFANGILVSNSDSFGLLCVSYDEPTIATRRPSRRVVEHGWMG